MGAASGKPAICGPLAYCQMEVVENCCNQADCMADCQAFECDDRAAVNVQEDELMLAAKTGDYRTVQMHVAKGTDVNCRQPLKLVARVYKGSEPVRNVGYSPLMYAAQNGHLRTVQALIEGKADVNAMDEDGVTPLHLAAASGELDVFTALLSAGAHCSLVDTDGNGVLDYLPQDVVKDKLALSQWEAAYSGASGAII